MTDVTAQNILDLYNTGGGINPVLADDLDGTLSIVERVTARGNHWPILAYRVDLWERFGWPQELAPADAQTVADEINAALSMALAKAAASFDIRRREQELTRYSGQIILTDTPEGVVVNEAPERSTADIDMYKMLIDSDRVKVVKAIGEDRTTIEFGTADRGFGVVRYAVTPFPDSRVVLLDRVVPPPTS